MLQLKSNADHLEIIQQCICWRCISFSDFTYAQAYFRFKLCNIITFYLCLNLLSSETAGVRIDHYSNTIHYSTLRSINLSIDDFDFNIFKFNREKSLIIKLSRLRIEYVSLRQELIPPRNIPQKSNITRIESFYQ